jgi:hypothetical protein
MNTTAIGVVVLYLAAFYILSKKALAQLQEINRVMLELLVGEEE